MGESKKEVSVVIKALDDTVPGFKSARGHVQEFSTEAKKMIGEAFAGFTVFEFFKTAIEKSTEAEQSYVQLSNTLANVGVDYEKNREQIEATIKSLQKVANVRSDDAIKGFNTLVQRSGDYKGSLSNMVLVADLAKAKHLEFNDAAELVGRVMGGNTRVLKQFGIVTKDSADGIQQLKEKLHGAAEADLKTFGGQVEATKVSFLNMAEAVGDVITNNSNLQGILASVRAGFTDLAAWVEKNQHELGFWFTVLVAGGKEGINTFIDVGKAAFHLGETIGAVAKAGLAWLKGDSEGTANWMAIAKNASEEVGESLHHVVLAHERLSTAIDNASQKEAEGVKRSQAELAKAKDANDARQAARKKAAEDARAKEEAKRQAEADKIVDNTIARAGKAAQLRDVHDRAIREAAIAQLNLSESLARQEMKGLDDSNKGRERRLFLEDRLAKILEEKKKAGITKEDPLAGLEGKPISGSDMISADVNHQLSAAHVSLESLRKDFVKFKVDFTTIPKIGLFDQIGNAAKIANEQIDAGGDAVDRFKNAMADLNNGPLADFEDGAARAMAAFITGSGHAGEAFLAAMKKALAGVASIEAQYFEAKATAGIAKAWGGDLAGVGEAAQYTLAAAAMFAVAGLAGGGGGGGGSGAGFGGSAASFSSAQNAIGSPSKGYVTVVFPSGRSVLDLKNQADRDAVTAMIQSLDADREVVFSTGDV